MIMDRLYGGVCYAGNIIQPNLTPFVRLNYCPFSFSNPLFFVEREKNNNLVVYLVFMFEMNI